VFFLIAISASSLGHGPHFEITLRRNAKGIGHAIEEGKQRRNIHRLCDLGLAPTMIAEKLHVFRGCAVGGLGHSGDIFEENPLSRGEPGLVEFSLGNRLYCFLVGSLNPQEVCV
jgi:hypothetical protein